MGCGSTMQMIQVSKVVNIEAKQKQQDKVKQCVSIDLNSSGFHKSLIKDSQRSIQSAKLKQVEKQQVEDTQTLRDKRMFLFGETEVERKIVLFQGHQFMTLSSRSNIPNSPIKYQPSEIILEESQELCPSNLYNKYSHPPYNFMFSTYISPQILFLCGGINYKSDYISDETFIYTIKEYQKKNNTLLDKELSIKKSQTNLMGTKFQKLDFMNYRRYSHMGAYIQINKRGYVYVFGGQGENDEILKHCQRYSIQERKWSNISPMIMQRSTGFSFVFKYKIYIFGGYSGEKKRSKIIEVYDPCQNSWQRLHVKLHRGIEAGLVYSVSPNEILLIGGNMEFGALQSVIRINLVDYTYIWQSNMKHNRFLQKGLHIENQIIIFGGDFTNSMQKYSIKQKKWRDIDLHYEEHIPIEIINNFSYATPTLHVKLNLDISASKLDNSYQNFHIFGNDNFPCILEINLNKWMLKKKNVPMALRLKSNMSIIQIKTGEYFICGGIDSMMEKASKAVYLYYSETNKAIEAQKMTEKKYACAICKQSTYVYIFGGRSNSSAQFLSSSQRFNLTSQKWQKLPQLSYERAQAKAISINEQNIAIFGGFDIFRTVSEIEIFNCETNTLSSYTHDLPISSDVKSFIFLNLTKQIIIFSHNNVLQKDFTHKFSIRLQEENRKNKNQNNNIIQFEKKMSKETENDEKLKNKIDEQESAQFLFQELNLKMFPFHHSFTHENYIYFLSGKGLFKVSVEDLLKSQKIDQGIIMIPQVLMNQVQLLQYPIDKFSCTQ